MRQKKIILSAHNLMLNKAVYQRKRKSKVRDSILLFGSNIFSLSHAREKKKKV